MNSSSCFQKAWPYSVFAVALFSYMPTFFIPILGSDEAGWGTMSRWIFSGHFYEVISDNKPPLHFQIHWLASLGENSLISLKFFIYICACVSAFGLYKCLAYFVPEGQSRFCALLYALLSGLVNCGAYTGERVMIPFCVGASALCCSFLVARSKSLLKSFAVGIFIGAAIQIKQTALFLCIPALWILFFASPTLMAKIRHIFFVLIGVIGITFASWWLVGVPFSVIWREAYEMNFIYVGQSTATTAMGLADLLGNMSLMLGYEYLPVLIGSVGAISSRIFILRREDLKSPFAAVWLVGLVVICSITALSVGGRFYQQYFSVLLPALVITSVSCPSKWLSFKSIFIWSLLTVSSLHVFTVVRQVTGANRNWNPQIVDLIHRIKADTSPLDKIWISNSIYSAYWLTGRQPAVRYLYFLQVMHYVDPCRASDELLREDPNDSNFETLMADLEVSSPKVVFWTQSARNNCSDRLKLENFPSITRFLKQNYTLISHDDLGLYFLKKSSL